MDAKEEVLGYIDQKGPVDSATLAADLGYETQAGAAATLLRLHRHGHLHRQKIEGGAFLYSISPKGQGWLLWAAGRAEGTE